MAGFDTAPGRSFQRDGKEWLYFSGTGYLGMAHNANFRKQLVNGLSLYGSNFGGSRLSNYQFQIFEKAEANFARWTGAESALTLSSGTLAGQLVANYIQNFGQLNLAPATHPALWGSSLPFRGNFRDWAQEMIGLSFNCEVLFLAANALDPLRLEAYDFSFLNQLNPNCKTTLILDDSHGIGVNGKNGSGIYCQMPQLAHIELIVIASLGKALALPGGIILSSKTIIDQIKSAPQFGGASPIIPAYLYAYLNSQSEYALARQSLKYNIELFKAFAAQVDLFKYYNQYPVFYTAEQKLAAYLAEHKILISSFSYPSPADSLINRIVINALHKSSDIEQLINLLEKFPV